MTTNSVDDRYYLAWSGSYDFQRAGSDSQMQLFWAINNLLDETNPVFFDTSGRHYRIGARFGF